MDNIVFKYGALPPVFRGLLREQLYLARKYYNMLVEAENARREAIWGGPKSPAPPHPPQVTFDEKGKKDIKYCDCQECENHWEALRDKFFATPFLDIAPLRKQAAETGLYWGSYLLVERAFHAAQLKTKYFHSVRFKSWTEGGAVGVQIQANTSEEVMFKIEKRDQVQVLKEWRKAPFGELLRVETYRPVDPRKGRRAKQRRALLLRVGSIGNKPIWSDPIWFELHRPIPGHVKWACACLNYRGEQEEWSVQFTLTDVSKRTDEASSGYVAIDVGWRMLSPGVVRLAFARSSDGKLSELLLDSRWLGYIEYAATLQKIRDKRLNELKADKRFARVKKPHRVAEVVRTEQIQDANVMDWLKQERHLRQWELGCRRRISAIRNHAVKVWLRGLRRRYAVAIIKNSQHSEMKSKEKVKEAGMSKEARERGHHGAPGAIIEEICKVFGRTAGVAIVEAAKTTATCPECKEEMEVGKGLLVSCLNPKCECFGADQDRDRVSTQNLVDLYTAGRYTKPTARKSTPRFAKRHKKKPKG